MSDFTTIENLQCQVSASYGVVIKYGSRVIASDCDFKNKHWVEVYEFIDEPDESGLSDIECRLNLIAQQDGFDDNGHAVAWALEQ